MKAIIVTEFGDPETMKYTELGTPIVNPQQVLIRVEKTSVNFADIKSRYGKKGAGRLPFVPGLDAAENMLLQMRILLSYFPTTLTSILPPHVPSYLF